MSTVTRRLLLKVIQTASQPSQLTPLLLFTIEIISTLQILSLATEPLYFFDLNGDESTSLRTVNQLTYYIHFARILGRFVTGSGLTICVALIGVYLVSFWVLLIYSAFVPSEEKNLIGKILSIGFLIHSKILFYCIHYFLIQSLDTQTECSSDDVTCETAWVAILIISSVLNFVLALFKELLLYRPLKTNKDISSANNRCYPLMVLLQKTLVVCLLYFMNNPKAIVIAFNVILSIISLFLALETFPFHNLMILRINVVFMTLSFGFSLLLIPEIKGSWDYSLFIILAVCSLFVKLALIRLDYTLKRTFHMESKNPNAAMVLPSLLKEWVQELNMMPIRREYNRETLFLSGFLKDDIQEFTQGDGGRGLIKLKMKYCVIILGYFNQLRLSHPKNELLLLTLANIYAKKFKDVPRTIAILNYMRTLSPSLAVELVIMKLSTIAHKQSIKNKEQMNLAYEDYFEKKNRTIYLKKEIQKEISEHINFWKLIAQKKINSSAVYQKALEISQQSGRIHKYWQIYFQGNESTNFEFAVNYGYYLDIVQGLGFEGFKLIKNTYKSLENKVHAKVGDDTLHHKTGGILVVSIEPEKQGKILNICNSANSFFEVRKGTLIGMDINSIIPKAFCAKHNESISKVYARSKLDMSQHPASYVRTLDGQYFKAEVTIQLNSSMDQGLSFVVHVKRVAENESIIVVDSNNKIVEFSEDVGKTLSLTGKENTMTIESLCPDLLQPTTHGPRTLAELTHKNRLKDERDWDIGQNTKTEHEPLKHTEPAPLMTSHRELMLSSPGRDRDDAAHLLGFTPRQEARRSSCLSFFDTETHRNGKIVAKSRILSFNVINNDIVKRKMEFTVVIEDMYFFGGSYFRMLKLENSHTVTQILPQILTPVDNVAKVNTTFADNFPEDQEKREEEEDTEPTGKEEALLGGGILLQQLKPLAGLRSNEEGRPKQEKAKLSQIIAVHKVEDKNMPKAQSIASSQFSTNVLAKGLVTLFRENKISRLTRVTINIIYLTVFIVILTATIDTVSTKASLNSMENAVTLVDLINKRLYKGVFAWQTALKIMMSAFGISTDSSGSSGGGGGGGTPPSGGSGGPPSGGVGGGGGSAISGLQTFVETAVLDAIENNNLLQKEVIMTKERTVIEALYIKSIVIWDPEDHTASYLDSFRASEVLADDNIFLVNYKGTASALKSEPAALSSSNNTANSYLIEVENSIGHVTNYFTRTKDNNVRTLTTIFSVKNAMILVLFLFIFKLFHNILLSYRRLFKFVSKVRPETLRRRINQLEILKPYFEADNASIYDGTNKKALQKDRALIDVKSHDRIRVFSLKQLFLYMLKYLFLSLLFIVPSIVVFALSYKSFRAKFSHLETINNKMVISYRIGTQAGMILPSFYFYRCFHSYSDYKIRNDDPLDQFYLSVKELNNHNEILLTEILPVDDNSHDQYVHDMLTSDICSYVGSSFVSPCNEATGKDSGVGLLDINSKYYLVATQGMTQVLGGTSPSTTLDPYSVVLKDVYQVLAEHFLDMFKTAVQSDLSANSYHFKWNVSVILISAILIRVFVLTRFKEVDIGVRKILRVIPYQVIEDQKAFLQYLKREFKEDLDKYKGKSSE